MLKQSFLSIASAACALILCGPNPAHASSLCDSTPGNIVTNCGFETGSLSGYTVVNGPSAYSNAYGHNAHTGTYDLFMSNSASLPFGLSQTLSDTAGESYTYSFYVGYSGNNYSPNQFTASFDGTPELALVDVTAPYAFDPSSQYVLYSYTVTGTGSDTIAFSEYSGSLDFYLDDISVVGAGTPTSPGTGVTPEPSSLTLLGTGLIGFAGMYRRFRTRQI